MSDPTINTATRMRNMQRLWTYPPRSGHWLIAALCLWTLAIGQSHAANAPPSITIPTNQQTQTKTEGSPDFTVTVTITDENRDTVTIDATTSPPSSAFSLSVGPFANLTSSRTITIHPLDPNAFNLAPETVTVTAKDDIGQTNTVPTTFTVEITPVNDPPSFTAGNAIASPLILTEDTPTTVPDWATNVSAGPLEDQVLTFSCTPAHTALIENPTITKNPGTGKWDLVVTPKLNQTGTTTVTVTLTDDNTYGTKTAKTATATFNVTVNPVNDAPVLTPGIKPGNSLPSTQEDTAVEITYTQLQSALTVSDVDSAPINFQVTGLLSGSTAKLHTVGANSATDVTVDLQITATCLIDATHTLVWTPPAQASSNGTTPLSAFSVKAWDGIDLSFNAVSVPIVVTTVNDSPELSATLKIPNGLPGSTLEDTAVEITYTQLQSALTVTDVDSAPINFQVTGLLSGSTAKLHTVGTSPNTDVAVNLQSAATCIIDATHTLFWTPPKDVNSTTALTPLDALTVKAWDGTSLSANASTIPLIVTPANDAPVLATTIKADNSLPGTNEDTAVEITYAQIQSALTATDTEGDAIAFLVTGLLNNSSAKLHTVGTDPATDVAVNLQNPATVIIDATHSLIWTPPQDTASTGTTPLSACTMRAWDGSVLSVAMANIPILVTAVNDAPVLSTTISIGNSLPSTDEDGAVEITRSQLLSALTATDVDSTVTFRITGLPDGSSARLHTVGANATTDVAVDLLTISTCIIDDTHTLVWRPPKDAHSTTASGPLNACTVRAWDGALASANAVAIPIIVKAVDDPPSFTKDDNAVTHMLGLSPTPLLVAENALSDPDSLPTDTVDYSGMQLTVTLKDVAQDGKTYSPAAFEDGLVVMPVATLGMSYAVDSNQQTITVFAKSDQHVVAAYGGSTSGTTILTLSLAKTATPDDLAALAHSVCYRNTFGLAATNAGIGRIAEVQFKGKNNGSKTTSHISLVINNTAPVVKTNLTLNVAPLASTVIGKDSLETTDETNGSQTDAADIDYRIDAAPLYGLLLLSGIPLKEDDVFSQDDLNQGRIVYTNTIDNALSDPITLAVSDNGTPRLSTPLTLGIRIAPELNNYLIISDPPMFADANTEAPFTVTIRKPTTPDSRSYACFIVPSVIDSQNPPEDQAAVALAAELPGFASQTDIILPARDIGLYIFDIIYAPASKNSGQIVWTRIADAQPVARQTVLLRVLPPAPTSTTTSLMPIHGDG